MKTQNSELPTAEEQKRIQEEGIRAMKITMAEVNARIRAIVTNTRQ